MKRNKKLFNARTLDKIIISVVIMFVLSGAMSTFAQLSDMLKFEARIASLMQSVQEYNSKNIDFFYTEGSNLNYLPRDDEYESSEEALVSAFENFSNADSYYSEAEGEIRASIFGYGLYADVFFRRALYPNGDFFQEVFAAERGDRFGGRVGAMLIYFDAAEQKTYYNFTWDTEKRDNNWYPNYANSAWEVISDEQSSSRLGYTLGDPMYQINDTTLRDELHFSVRRNNSNGKIFNYYTQHALSPSRATQAYRSFVVNLIKIIREDAVRAVSFQEVIMSAVIGPDGNLQTVNVYDKINLRAYVYFLNITVNTTATSNMNYLYTNINSDIDVERPQIPEEVRQ